jgi:2-polyprenyl-3-methyl-5-hydroxy-6-metoxy-1,4-benzoquinol methylase
LDYANDYTREELIMMYWQAHPRFRFFKNVVDNAVFLDVGAANGGLTYWKKYAWPVRKDIRMYGIDIHEIELKKNYIDTQVMNLEDDEIKWGKDSSFFDVIYMANALEHIQNGEKVIHDLSIRLKKGGRLYIEVPNDNMLTAPKRTDLLQKGFVCSTINFYDDATHVRCYNRQQLHQLCISNNLSVVESGDIENLYLEGRLLKYAYENKDAEITTYALWLKYRVIQFMVCLKV